MNKHSRKQVKKATLLVRTLSLTKNKVPILLDDEWKLDSIVAIFDDLLGSNFSEDWLFLSPLLSMLSAVVSNFDFGSFLRNG